jgi:hypothetical protein
MEGIVQVFLNSATHILITQDPMDKQVFHLHNGIFPILEM